MGGKSMRAGRVVAQPQRSYTLLLLMVLCAAFADVMMTLEVGQPFNGRKDCAVRTNISIDRRAQRD